MMRTTHNDEIVRLVEAALRTQDDVVEIQIDAAPAPGNNATSAIASKDFAPHRAWDRRLRSHVGARAVALRLFDDGRRDLDELALRELKAALALVASREADLIAGCICVPRPS
jgi:hypothetical protein